MIDASPGDFSVSSASAMLLKIVEILVALILALYTLASLPALAASSSDFLRRVSSPIFVFAVLNASIILLSFSRISPPKRESTTSSSPPPLIGPEIEDEFEIRHETKRMIVAAVAEDEIEAERNEISDRLEIVEDCSDGDDRCLEMVQAAEEEEEEDEEAVAAATECDEEEIVEELSNAEFNRIIEAFLEKQKRFHYQENLSILV